MRRSNLPRRTHPSLRGAPLATKQSPAPHHRRLLRCARNDSLPAHPSLRGAPLATKQSPRRTHPSLRGAPLATKQSPPSHTPVIARSAPCDEAISTSHTPVIARSAPCDEAISPVARTRHCEERPLRRSNPHVASRPSLRGAPLATRQSPSISGVARLHNDNRPCIIAPMGNRGPSTKHNTRRPTWPN